MQVTSQNLVAADFLSTDSAPPLTCDVSGAPSDLTLANTGTGSASVIGVVIDWAGAVNYFSVPGTCIVEPAGHAGATDDGNPISILFGTVDHLGVNAVAGQTYTGEVNLADGTQVPFSGTFK